MNELEEDGGRGTTLESSKVEKSKVWDKNLTSTECETAVIPSEDTR